VDHSRKKEERRKKKSQFCLDTHIEQLCYSIFRFVEFHDEFAKIEEILMNIPVNFANSP